MRFRLWMALGVFASVLLVSGAAAVLAYRSAVDWTSVPSAGAAAPHLRNIAPVSQRDRAKQAGELRPPSIDSRKLAALRSRLIITSMALALVAGLCGWAMGGRLSIRFEGLARAMAAFGRGDAVHLPPGELAGSGEISRLYRAFQTTADERRQLQARLERNEARFALAQRTGGIGTWEWDMSTDQVYWSEHICDMFGLQPGEFAGTYTDYLSRVHPEDREAVLARTREYLKDGGRYESEHRIIRSDGAIRWISGCGETTYDAAGKPVALLGVVRDVTESREAERALRASEAGLAEAQALAHLGSWDLDLATGEASWSAETYRLLGHAPQGIEPRVENFLKAVHPEDLAAVRLEMDAAKQRTDGRFHIEHRLRLPNGDERVVLARGRVTHDFRGRPARMVGTALDVTDLRRTEQALRDTELRLRSVVVGAPIVLFALNREGVFTLSEGQALAAIGLRPGEVVGQSALDLYSENPELIDHLHRALSGERFTGQARVGSRIFSVRYTPLLDRDGAPQGIIGVALDDTERWQAHQELVRHRDYLEDLVAERTARLAEQARIIDEIHDAVVTADLDGKITSWNRGAERMFGYRAREIIGRSVSVLHMSQGSLQEEIIDPLRAMGRHQVELTMRRKDGSELTGHLSLALRFDPRGQPVGMIAYTTDVTERTRAELLLRQRTQELQAANAELESFSYSVSHDLRGPLRAVDGFSQALMEDYADRLDATATDYLRRIRAGAQRMGELIDDLLQLSRVARAELRSESVDLSAIAREQVELLRLAYPERHVAVDVAPGLTARGDPNLLRTLLQNLLENAWKFTGGRDTAHIAVSRVATEHGEAYCVADNGAGFDMHYADKLFAPFQRLHRADEFEGTGIGLATVQRIINRHGGRVWATAEVEQGAAFYFQLAEAGDLPQTPAPGGPCIAE